jgi:hypothetical protein
VFDCLPEDINVYLHTDWPLCCDAPMLCYLGSFLISGYFLPGLILGDCDGKCRDRADASDGPP